MKIDLSRMQSNNLQFVREFEISSHYSFARAVTVRRWTGKIHIYTFFLFTIRTERFCMENEEN